MEKEKNFRDTDNVNFFKDAGYMDVFGKFIAIFIHKVYTFLYVYYTTKFVLIKQYNSLATEQSN